ncbi:Nardilysin [Tupaia chinensis]|uniref:Nardilysin n=1 Tax=Tupaia chinensis TaxID=246437 RepID=L9KSK9_TUPCH|nr:Nardilysin [Tupaia chinensis]
MSVIEEATNQLLDVNLYENQRSVQVTESGLNDGCEHLQDTVRATVPTGFEQTAADEVREKLGSSCKISKDLGKIYFDVSVKSLAQVHCLRSVDNLFVVVQEFKDYQFKKTKEEVLKDFEDLAGKLPCVVLFDIFVNILTHNLAEPAYEADVAQLEYKLVAGEHGLIIRVKGFNHKLPLLFQLIIDYLAEFSSTPAVFTMITEQLKKTYFNILIKPETLAKDVRLLILEYARWSMIDKYRALMDGLSLESLLSFVKEFKSQLFVEGLVQGNVTSTESMDFLKYVVDKLNFKPLEQEMPVQFQVVELPSGHHLCKVRALNKGDANSEVTVYYQMHMEEPCFDFLRTKQTLGLYMEYECLGRHFSLFPESRSLMSYLKMFCFSSEVVDKKIEEFLSSFEEKIENLTEDAFNTQVTAVPEYLCLVGQVTALIKLKECEDTHLGEEVDRNWNEVVTQQYLFDRLAHEIEALKSFSKSDLVNWFKAHRGLGSKMLSVHVSMDLAPSLPRLSFTEFGLLLESTGFAQIQTEFFLPQVFGFFQVVGYGKYELEDDGAPSGEDSNLSCEVMQLTHLPTSPLLTDSTIPITDIRAFTSTLSLLPYHKIVK